MMARAHPQVRAAAVPAADTPLLAEIFRASIEELTGDDYSEASSRPGLPPPTTKRRSPRGWRDQLTLIATMNGSPVGFASLANNETIDMLYVHPAAAGQGAGTMLVDALEKLAAARGASAPHRRRSDSAQDFFRKRGFVADAAQHRPARRRMARQHHDGKAAAKERRDEQARHAVPAPLALLHRAQIAVIVVVGRWRSNYYLW